MLPDAPEAPAWAAEAGELFERVGAAPYLARLAALRIASEPAATRAPTAAGAEVAAEPS